MKELLNRLEEGGLQDGEIITEGGMSWKVFNVDSKVITKKRIFKYLTDKEPKGAEYIGLQEKTLEIDPPEKLDKFMAGGASGYHSLFRCWGEVPGPNKEPEKYKAWGYVYAGVKTTSNGVEVTSLVYVKV